MGPARLRAASGQPFAPLVPAPADRALPPVRPALPPTTAVALTAPLRTAFSRLASRLRLRAAVFLWIVFFDATRSRRDATLLSSCSALVMSPLVRAVLKDLIWSL